jgi:hypothetical protein
MPVGSVAGGILYVGTLDPQHKTDLMGGCKANV